MFASVTNEDTKKDHRFPPKMRILKIPLRLPSQKSPQFCVRQIDGKTTGDIGAGKVGNPPIGKEEHKKTELIGKISG